MKTEFAFGKAGIAVELPDGYGYSVLAARSAAPLANAAASIGSALDAPIGCPPLAELAKGKRSAAISVCDITRPAPNPLTLPPLLERLQLGGIAARDITILIATGLHRGATGEEVQAIVGPEVARSYRILNHDAKARAEHRFLGTTRRETPVYIDERFMAADLHVTLGFIEQHLMLGFSGGRKLIAPGLAAQETIKAIHAPRFMREPAAVEGSIDDNPLHHELLEIARMARHDFMLDVALTRNREIAGVFAGEPVQAHATGVDFIRRNQLVEIPECVDGVITCAAGYPLDLTLYQSIKAVTAAQQLVKPGGRILVLTECAEGVGSGEFAGKLRQMRSYASFLEAIEGSPVEVDQWQLEKLALAGQRCEILFYAPGVGQSDLGALEQARFSDLNAALSAFFRGLPNRASIALIPEGPYAYARAGAVPVG